MKVTYHKFHSSYLNEEFEIKVWGDKGKPIMVFPTSCGRFFDYENNGMIDRMNSFIVDGEIQVICVDGRDKQSWFSGQGPIMGENHIKYEKCITKEVVKYCKDQLGITEKFMTTGNSWGGFHALNFSLKFPDIFDSAISLSAAYRPQSICGEYFDQNIYYNDMISYMPNLNDKSILSKLKQSYIIICHGKGNYELHNHDAWKLAQTLGKKQIPHWYSVWSDDSPHDWCAWHKQIVYFLHHLKDGIKTPSGIKYILGNKRTISTIKL